MNSYERVLRLYEEMNIPLTEEEFLRIYNLPCEEFCVEDDMMRNNQIINAAFTHLFVAFHTTYPQKSEEWSKKWNEFKRRKEKQNSPENK